MDLKQLKLNGSKYRPDFAMFHKLSACPVHLHSPSTVQEIVTLLLHAIISGKE